MRIQTRTLSVICLLAVLASVAGAQADGRKPNILDVKFGGTRDYVSSRSKDYYDISILGKPFLSQGDAPVFSDFSAGGLADVTTRPFFLSLKRGISDVGGSFFSGYDTTPIKDLLNSKGGAGLSDFNIVLGVDAQLDENRANAYTYGLEYKPIAPFKWLRDSKGLPLFSNFAILGIAGQSHSDDSSDSSTRTIATVRGMIGMPLYFKSNPVDSLKEKRLRLARDQFGSKYVSVLVMEDLFQKKKANVNTYRDGIDSQDERDLVQYLVILYGVLSDHEGVHTVPTQSEWDEKFRGGIITSLPPNPDIALWADGNAGYAFSGLQSGDRRWRSIFSINAKYYIDPQSGSSYLQAQYLNGFNEATPDKRSNSLLIFLGIQF